jgi:hypothetical protein
MAMRHDGIRSIRSQFAAQRRLVRIGWDVTADEISRDVGVGQFEKLDESGAFFV